MRAFGVRVLEAILKVKCYVKSYVVSVCVCMCNYYSTDLLHTCQRASGHLYKLKQIYPGAKPHSHKPRQLASPCPTLQPTTSQMQIAWW